MARLTALSAAAALTLSGGALLLPAAPAHAADTGSSCLGVSINGSDVQAAPNVTVAPGAFGGFTLNIANTSPWSDGTVQASITDVHIEGDDTFASDLRLGIGPADDLATMSAKELAQASTPPVLATQQIPAGGSIDLRVGYDYPDSVTQQPAQASSVSYKVALHLAGDQENTLDVSCSTAPPAPAPEPAPQPAPVSNPMHAVSVARMVKTAVPGKIGVGDQVAYDISVENTSGQQITGLQVTSKVIPGLSPAGESTDLSTSPASLRAAAATSGAETPLKVNCPTSELTAGQTTTCSTEPYTIKDSDVAAGGITGISRVSATGITGTEVTANDTTTPTGITLAAPTPAPTVTVPVPGPTVTAMPVVSDPAPADIPGKGFTIIDAGVAALASPVGLGSLLGGVGATGLGVGLLRRRMRRG